MDSINNAVSSNLLNNNANISNPTPVVELYPRAYGQTDAGEDTFTPSEQNLNTEPKKKGALGKILRYTAISAAIIFAGKKGLFGKKIKTWFGGTPRVKPEKIFENIETKISEFLGKNNNAVKSSKITKATDGSSVLKAEFENGIIREYKVTEGESVIKLFGKNEQNLEEFIVFGKADGVVKSRTVLARDSKGKVQAYANYRGEDVLNPDFNEVTGIYKDYWKRDINHKYKIFGPKQVVSETRTFTNTESGEPFVTTVKKTFKNGKVSKLNVDRGEKSVVDEFLYDKNGNVDKHFVYPKK